MMNPSSVTRVIDKSHENWKKESERRGMTGNTCHRTENEELQQKQMQPH